MARQGGMRDAVGRGGQTGFDADEAVIWKGHPSLLSLVWLWLACIGLAMIMHDIVDVLDPALRRGAAAMPAGFLEGERIALWMGMTAVLPVLYVCWKTLELVMVRYEITSQRLVVNSGILLRRRDEIELHRMRDYRVIRPLWLVVLGLGMVHLVSRDETHPHKTLGPLACAYGIADLIRRASLARKQEMGYREMETQ